MVRDGYGRKKRLSADTAEGLGSLNGTDSLGHDDSLAGNSGVSG
jgi:hypothetical protein